MVKNTEYLADKPFRKFLDLAVIYHVVLKMDNKEIVSLVVTNLMCEKYSVSIEELEFAMRRNRDILSFSVKTSALPETSFSIGMAGEDGIWIFTTRS